MDAPKIKLGNHTIGDEDLPYIIAELGANFNGDFGIAEEMVAQAAAAGIQAAKFQSWTKESIMIRQLYAGKKAEITSFGHSEQSELLDYLSLSEADHVKAKALCDKYGLHFSSTPISFRHVDLLVDLDVPFLKVASMDLNHPLFIRYIAEQQRPVILSTGMGSYAEIDAAVKIFQDVGNDQLVLLHCTSLYPPNDDEINLLNLGDLQARYPYPVGYSDHSLGVTIPLAAVALGAPVIEKHYTLDKGMEGWDHAVSATADEFAQIVTESRRILLARGHKEHRLNEREAAQKSNFRRSLVYGGDLKAGTVLRLEDITYKRPGTGIPPAEYASVVGKTLGQDVQGDTLISQEQFV